MTAAGSSRQTVQSVDGFFCPLFFTAERENRTPPQPDQERSFRNRFHVRLSLKFGPAFADNPTMEKNTNGSWQVSKKGETISVLGPDSAVVAELPKGNNDDELRITIAYLIVAAPKLFEMCCKIKSIFENNLIVTREGFKINCSDIEKSLLDAILRARGYTKTADEP